MKIVDWFAEHPQALAAVERWSLAKKRGKAEGGVRGLLADLKAAHAYPFKDHTALWNFMKKELGQESTVEAPAVHTGSRTDAEVRKIEKSADFIVSCAVNNCNANEDFLRALEYWREEHSGKIVANPIRYVNPTRPDEVDEDEWWDPALAPYMLAAEIRPHERLSIMPTKVQATTNNPLPPRLDGLTQGRSAIFGHPQLMMRTVPTLDGAPKLMWSSGAVTEKRYSDTLTGHIADFHHGYSAVIAQVRDDRVYMREVTWDGAAFIDCDLAYTAQGIAEAPAPLALVMGDIHVGLVSAAAMEATFGENGIYPCMSHERIVIHDLANSHSVNPHEARKVLTRAAMAREGKNDVARELQEIAEWVNEVLPAEPEIIVDRANHDEFLRRWLEAGERAVEPLNKKLYHRLSYQMLHEREQTGEWPVPLELALRGVLRPGVRFLDFDEPFRLAGVELGQHGHLGQNGSRGSIRGYSRLGCRSIIGHSHAPGIHQGVYQVGHSSEDRHEYNIGPSGWHKGHASLHANGYRQMHLILNDGTWRPNG